MHPNDQDPARARHAVMSPVARGRIVATVVVLGTVWLVPGVWSHGTDHALDDDLVDGGHDLMVGRFAALQPGPLIVVPYTDGPLGCTGTPQAEYRLALGDDVGVMFATNATTVQLLVDMPPEATGYTAFAVDTHDATRALLEMQEHAVARHALVAVVRSADANGTTHDASTGVLGVPYALGDAAHGGHGDQGRTYFMDHTGSPRATQWCTGPAAGHIVMAFNRTDLPGSLTPGMLVHVVALVDTDFAQYLPRALEQSTMVLEANLYLARPGEDPARVRAALDPAPSAHDVVPVAALTVGLVVVVARSRLV